LQPVEPAALQPDVEENQVGPPRRDCCGCVIAAAEGSTVELRCNECGAVVGVVLIDVLRALIRLDE